MLDGRNCIIRTVLGRQTFQSPDIGQINFWVNMVRRGFRQGITYRGLCLLKTIVEQARSNKDGPSLTSQTAYFVLREIEQEKQLPESVRKLTSFFKLQLDQRNNAARFGTDEAPDIWTADKGGIHIKMSLLPSKVQKAAKELFCLTTGEHRMFGEYGSPQLNRPEYGTFLLQYGEDLFSVPSQPTGDREDCVPLWSLRDLRAEMLINFQRVLHHYPGVRENAVTIYCLHSHPQSLARLDANMCAFSEQYGRYYTQLSGGDGDIGFTHNDFEFFVTELRRLGCYAPIDMRTLAIPVPLWPIDAATLADELYLTEYCLLRGSVETAADRMVRVLDPRIWG